MVRIHDYNNGDDQVYTLDDDNDDNNDQVYTSDHQLAIRTARSLAAASGFSRTHIIGFIQQIKS